jgi:hypothetical protein
VSQAELPFSSPSGGGGYHRWLEQRRSAQRELAHRLGVPLGHQVEVWLLDGVRLRGKLELAESRLFVSPADEPNLQLAIGRATFTLAEMESCVRMD